MKKLFYLFPLAFIALFVIACSSDDGIDNTKVVDIHEGSDNSTDVAVTGAVYSKGMTHAGIYGYVNLDRLPSSSKMRYMGIQLWSSGSNYPSEIKTNEITNKNRLDFSLNSLSPATEYTYRTYVETNDLNYYGEKKTFTTDGNLENVVTSYDVKDVTQFGATISYTVDVTKFPSDQIDANKTYVKLKYSYKQANLTESNIQRTSSNDINVGKYSEFVNLRDDQTQLEYSISSNPDSTVYYVFYTQIGNKICMGPVKQFTCLHLPLETSGAADLGLSVKWAACNLGASNPWDYGERYAWGETSSKDYYAWDNYKWSEYYSRTRQNAITKYTIESDLTTLIAEDDAATVNWGSEWRIPTYSEQKELIDKCTWSLITLHDISGYYIVGPNGNAIFLPSNNNNSYFWTSYWSSSLYDDTNARCIMGNQRRSQERYKGWYIRAVHN